jgi:hypothetical protein
MIGMMNWVATFLSALLVSIASVFGGGTPSVLPPDSSSTLPPHTKHQQANTLPGTESSGTTTTQVEEATTSLPGSVSNNLITYADRRYEFSIRYPNDAIIDNTMEQSSEDFPIELSQVDQILLITMPRHSTVGGIIRRLDAVLRKEFFDI